MPSASKCLVQLDFKNFLRNHLTYILSLMKSDAGRVEVESYISSSKLFGIEVEKNFFLISKRYFENFV